MHPNYLNYPKITLVNRFCFEQYFALCAINMYKGVPNLACRTLEKFTKTLLLCIKVFRDNLPYDTSWDIFLEDNQALSFDLNKGPNRIQVLGIFCWCMFFTISSPTNL